MLCSVQDKICTKQGDSKIPINKRATISRLGSRSFIIW
jgi:hypothetical protein